MVLMKTGAENPKVAYIPFKIAAFPDLIANAAMFAMTSGRASKIMRRTPMGQLTLSRVRPSSRRVRSDTFPTAVYQVNDCHRSQVT
jgi:hypothetical protein